MNHHEAVIARNIKTAEAYSSGPAYEPPDQPDCLDDCRGLQPNGDWNQYECDCDERIAESEADARADAAESRLEARNAEWE